MKQLPLFDDTEHLPLFAECPQSAEVDPFPVSRPDVDAIINAIQQTLETIERGRIALRETLYAIP